MKPIKLNRTDVLFIVFLAIQPNFDIYLPNWLAINNKVIYTSIFAVTMIALLLRLLDNN
jgi:hypothetical protein